MSTNFYETDRAAAEYLLFHYGAPEEFLPYAFGPADALEFPARCVSECVDPSRLPARARALDLGCAVGRSSFELAKHCIEVVGIDFSERFVQAADCLRREGRIEFAFVEEGSLVLPGAARVPADIDRGRVSFLQGDATDVPSTLGQFDVVLLANLIDRLREPRRCLSQLRELTQKGAQVVITSPYTWLEEYTPRVNWLGGFERDGKRVATLDSLKDILGSDFQLVSRKDLPFIIREHARKFQWSVAEATVWIRT